MKKICALFILAASMSMLNADNCGGCGCPANYQQGPNQPGFSNQQGYGYNQNQPGASQNQPGYGYNQSANASQSDQQLTKKVQDSLQGLFSKKYDNVKVAVNNGTATLTGTVASQDDKKDLEQKVRGISGIQNVDNQVTVVQNQGQGASAQPQGQAPAPQSND